MGTTKRQRTWLECNFTWGNPPDPFTWNDVWIIVEAGNVILGGGQKDWDKWQKREDKKKKKLIRLICTIKGEKFEESKYAGDAKIDIKDIELLVEKALGKKMTITFDDSGEK